MAVEIRNEMESEDFEDIQQLIDDLPEDSKRFTDHILNIPRYVKFLLLHQDKSQNDVAQYLGKSESEISKWLSGRQNMTLRTISKLEAALSFDIINPNIKVVVESLKTTYKKRSSIKSYQVNNVIHLFILPDRNKEITQTIPNIHSIPNEPINLSLSDYGSYS